MGSHAFALTGLGLRSTYLLFLRSVDYRYVLPSTDTQTVFKQNKAGQLSVPIVKFKMYYKATVIKAYI
jgi:hypothetical protein